MRAVIVVLGPVAAAGLEDDPFFGLANLSASSLRIVKPASAGFFAEAEDEKLPGDLTTALPPPMASIWPCFGNTVSLSTVPTTSSPASAPVNLMISPACR